MKYWISKGDNCFVDNLTTKISVDGKLIPAKHNQDGLYDLISPNDTIVGGIEVITIDEYNKLKAQVDYLKSALANSNEDESYKNGPDGISFFDTENWHK